MEHQIEIRQMFDESFKKKVIEEYLATGGSKMELLRKYNIHFKSAIQTWMKRLGYADPYAVEGRTFEIIKQPTLAKKPKAETNEELLKRIRELERQLEDEKLRSELYSRIIEKAEKELKIPIRKKPNTK
jgi:transposase